MAWTIKHGDALEKLREMPDESVQCCVTSPPYWGLRDYGTARWDGGDAECDHARFLGGNGAASSKQVTFGGTQKYQYRDLCAKCGAIRVDGQLGLERTPEEYVAKMVEVFREVRRVLRNDGSLWLNIGDSYNAHPGQRKTTDAAGSKQLTNEGAQGAPSRYVPTMKPKDLCGVPWLLAFALRADGWYLRSAIIWAKPNGMPGSQEDRPTSSYENIFLLSKSERYFSDFDAIKTPPRESSRIRLAQDVQSQAGSHRANGGAKTNGPMKAVARKVLPENQSKVGGYRDKQRGHSRRHDGFNDRWDLMEKAEQQSQPAMMRDVWFVAPAQYAEAHFAVMPKEIARRCITAGTKEGDAVLDPFSGAGTTGLVATRLMRNYIGIELNESYVEMAHRRIEQDAPLFNSESVCE